MWPIGTNRQRQSALPTSTVTMLVTLRKLGAGGLTVVQSAPEMQGASFSLPGVANTSPHFVRRYHFIIEAPSTPRVFRQKPETARRPNPPS